jgi:hypothetical protein
VRECVRKIKGASRTFAPRAWQTVAKSNDAEQPLNASMFGISSFFQHAGEYLRLLARPLEVEGPHSPVLMILGAGGLCLLLLRFFRSLRRKELPAHHVHFAVFVAVLLGMECVVCFSYV